MFVITNAQCMKPSPIKNVLSLFDGISGGQLALKMAGIPYERYYASEVEDFSIRVTQRAFPETVQLGDVQKVQGKDLPQIDLLFAGSPCQGLSRCGHRKNFEDERSKLYYEFLRLLEETKPKFFLLENVCMDAESENIITEDLGVKPYFINSQIFCGQQRARLYWTNLPVKNLPFVPSRTVVRDVLEPNPSVRLYTPPYLKMYDWEAEQNYVSRIPFGKFSRRVGQVGDNPKAPQAARVYSLDAKSVCLLANGGGQGAKTGMYAIDEQTARVLTPLECERLQGLPDNYTVGGSNSERYKAIGNGWTVDVIAHILQGIK